MRGKCNVEVYLMEVLNTDVIATIFQIRGLLLMKEKLGEHNIDYNKMCTFLKQHDGYLVGSCVMACFDNSVQTNTLDIVVRAQYEDNVIEDFWKTVQKVPIRAKIQTCDRHHFQTFDTCIKLHNIRMAKRFVNIIVADMLPLSFGLRFDGNEWIVPLVSANIPELIFNKLPIISKMHKNRKKYKKYSERFASVYFYSQCYPKQYHVCNNYNRQYITKDYECRSTQKPVKYYGGGGWLMNLVAYGAQDAYLSANSFF